MTLEKDITAAVKAKKALLGSKSTLKAARNKKLKSLVHAKNVPKNIMADVKAYSAISGLEVREFSGNSQDLGELCGKPFAVLLLGIRK